MMRNSASDRMDFWTTWSGPAMPFRDGRSLISLFEEQARLRPDAVAFEGDGVSLTYGQLNHRAQQLGRRLRERGVTPGVPVALCANLSMETAVFLLAILKAGGAYVPMDPASPPDRLDFLIQEARPAVALVSAALHRAVPAFSASDAPVILHPEEVLEPGPLPDPPDELGTPSADAVAYILFTSGSTGRPKGVCCSHRGVVNLLDDVQRRQPLGPGDRCSVWTRLTFDVSVYEIFSAWIEGATLVVVPSDIRTDAPRFMDWLDAAAITSAYLPPFMAADLESHVGAALSSRSRLRRVLTGVEPIPERVLASLRAALPGLELINGYGPTETTICATLYSVPPTPPPGHVNAPIGRAVQNLHIVLMDEQGQPVLPGETGELWIGGVGVALGYLNRPDLTAERFVPDPYADRPGARMYRTGDLARLLPDGELEFVGRADFQIKFRGHRMEPGEIETRLREHAAVREAVVLLREDSPGYPKLAVYYTLRDGAPEPEPNELREFLSKRLPEYMIPSAFVRLGQMPVTMNGKTDRTALPAPEDEIKRPGFRPPPASLERRLAAIWTEVLGVESLSVTDDFFDLGGHSLAVTRVIGRVRDLLHLDLTPEACYRHRTLEKIAAHLVPRGDGSALYSEAPRARPERRRFPATAVQREMWALEQRSGVPGLFTISLRLDLQGELTPGRAVTALGDLIRRHAALRTRFEGTGSALEQVVADETEVETPVTDLRSASGPEVQQKLEQLGLELNRQPFDAAVAPLLRNQLVRRGEAEWTWLMAIHHSVFDGWSARVFLKELMAGLAGPQASAPLPPPDLSFGDVALWQQSRLREGAYEDSFTYWRERLQDAGPAACLPSDRPRGWRMAGRGERGVRRMPTDIVDRLRHLAHQEQTGLFVVLTALLQLLLHARSGQDDIRTGTTVARRNAPWAEGLIGPFITSIPLRTVFGNDPDFTSLLRRVRSGVHEALAHSDVPFEAMEELSGTWPSPLFTVSLVLQNMLWPGAHDSGLRGVCRDVGNGTAKLDLLIYAEEQPEGLDLLFEYNADLFDASTLAGWGDDFLEMASRVASDPAYPLSGLVPEPKSVFTCWLFGEGSLAVRCGDAVRECGGRIRGVISSDPDVLNWARDRGIFAGVPDAHLRNRLAAHPFDYLFSVVNSVMLKKDILSLPARAAINYHDAPLPAYAGVHATAWALLHGEREHGITWHAMVEKADAGDVFRQARVPVYPEDTSLTLNARCHETAFSEFRLLLADLLSGSVAPQPQDLSRRTYFSLNRRPPGAGFLDWTASAVALDAQVRALHFGDTYPNDLGSAKVYGGATFAVARRSRVAESASGQPPGTLVGVDSDVLTVACGTGDLHLLALCRPDGTILQPAEWIASLGISVGLRFPEPPAGFFEAAEKAMEAKARYEPYWVALLSDLQPVDLPVPRTAADKPPQWQALPIPDGFPPEAVACLLARLHPSDTMDVGFRSAPDSDSRLAGLWVDIVPWRLRLDLNRSWNELRDPVRRDLEAMVRRGAYAVDLPARYPGVSGEFRPDLMFDAVEQRWLYDASVFDTGVLLPFAEACASFSAAPEGPIRELPLVSAETRLRLPAESRQGPERAEDPFIPVQRAILEQAQRAPEKIAVVGEHATWTYRTLRDRTVAIVKCLERSGVGPGQRVAVFAERRPETIAAMLAVLETHAAYVPLDPGYPPERLQTMLSDADVSAILITGAPPDWIALMSAPQIRVDACPEASADAEVSVPADPDPEDPAYVMYTSGSTGQPKGVVVPHRALRDFTRAAIGVYGITEADRTLQFFSLSFDGSVEEIYPTLSVGGTLVLRPSGPPPSADGLLDLIEARQISVLDVPTAYWHEWAQAIRGVERRPPESLRVVITGGEAPNLSAYRDWRAWAGPRIRWFNTYGPTECTVVATAFEPPPEPVEALPIGTPLPNATVAVVDRFLQPLPIGWTGELILGGSGVASGYLFRPEGTRRVFVKDPARRGGRRYRTGDRAHLRNDGCLVFDGRLDSQVKVRGHRVEPEELRRHLLEHPSVRQAAVKTVAGPQGESCLAAWVVGPQSEAELQPVHAFLRQRLPDYMRPRSLVTLDRLPLTPSGKINDRALPLPDFSAVRGPAEGDLPESTREVALAEIWSRLLGGVRVNRNDDFFALGGHSLLAVQLIARLEEVGLHLSVDELFRHPTLRQMAAVARDRFDEGDADPRWPSLVTLRRGTSGRIPLYFLHLSTGDLLVYASLIHHLPEEQPCHGFQSHGLVHPEQAHRTMEAMAEHYVNSLLAFQPEGPFALAGWCYGGNLAQEMAVRLAARNRPPSIVLLMGTWAHSPAHGKWTYAARRGMRLLRGGPAAWLDFASRRARARELARKVTPDVELGEIVQSGALSRRSAIYRINAAANRVHRTTYYPGRIVLINPEEDYDDRIPDPLLGWGGLATDITVRLSSGDHLSMMKEPNVGALQNILSALLASPP